MELLEGVLRLLLTLVVVLGAGVALFIAMMVAVLVLSPLVRRVQDRWGPVARQIAHRQGRCPKALLGYHCGNREGEC